MPWQVNSVVLSKINLNYKKKQDGLKTILQNPISQKKIFKYYDNSSFIYNAIQKIPEIQISKISIDNFKINNIKKSDKLIEFILRGQKYSGRVDKENFEIKNKTNTSQNDFHLKVSNLKITNEINANVHIGHKMDVDASFILNISPIKTTLHSVKIKSKDHNLVLNGNIKPEKSSFNIEDLKIKLNEKNTLTCIGYIETKKNGSYNAYIRNCKIDDNEPFDIKIEGLVKDIFEHQIYATANRKSDYAFLASEIQTIRTNDGIDAKIKINNKSFLQYKKFANFNIEPTKINLQIKIPNKLSDIKYSGEGRYMLNDFEKHFRFTGKSNFESTTNNVISEIIGITKTATFQIKNSININKNEITLSDFLWSNNNIKITCNNGYFKIGGKTNAHIKINIKQLKDLHFTNSKHKLDGKINGDIKITDNNLDIKIISKNLGIQSFACPISILRIKSDNMYEIDHLRASIFAKKILHPKIKLSNNSWKFSKSNFDCQSNIQTNDKNAILNIYGNIKNGKILISDLIVSEQNNDSKRTLLSNQKTITISKGFKHLNIENVHMKNIHDGTFACDIISSEKNLSCICYFNDFKIPASFASNSFAFKYLDLSGYLKYFDKYNNHDTNAKLELSIKNEHTTNEKEILHIKSDLNKDILNTTIKYDKKSFLKMTSKMIASIVSGKFAFTYPNQFQTEIKNNINLRPLKLIQIKGFHVRARLPKQSNTTSIKLDNISILKLNSGLLIEDLTCLISKDEKDFKIDGNSKTASLNCIIDPYSIKNTKINVHLNSLPVWSNHICYATASGDFSIINKDQVGWAMSGSLSCDKLILFLDSFGYIYNKQKRQKSPLNIFLDLDITANEFIIRGKGIESSLKGKVKVLGNYMFDKVLALTSGELNLLAGIFSIMNKNFKINSGAIKLNKGSVNIDFKSNIRLSGYDMMIQCFGILPDWKISFTSSPNLPEIDVLSILLFGGKIDKVSPINIIKMLSIIQQISRNQKNGEKKIANILDNFQIINNKVVLSRRLNKILGFELHMSKDTSDSTVGLNINLKENLKLGLKPNEVSFSTYKVWE